MGIKRSTFYYQQKVNRANIQQETLLKEKIQQIAYELPITATGESPHNCIGRI
jgi:hypothetical protein